MAKIFIVEDDPKLAAHLDKIIRKYEHDTFLVETFDNILEPFQQFSPDLVMLDINLPSFDG
ncbi:MAG: response regulator transcription factor, partial [Bacilli bacterium]|nr:response regulator transcription factor [Bacilli bacterium]